MSRLSRIAGILLAIILCTSLLPMNIESANAESSSQLKEVECEEYIVQLNGMGVSVYPSSITVTMGGIYGELPEPTKANYNFMGWFTKPYSGIKIMAGDTVDEPVPNTLYARWEGAERTIKLDPCRGYLRKTQLTVNFGDKYAPLPKPKRTGLKFMGWYTKKSGGTLFNSSKKVTLTRDIKLYAKWAPTWYLQTDKRWKKKWYRVRKENSTIGNAGCGPTSMAMVVASLKNQKITPVHACKWSKKKKYKAYLSGTKDGFFKKYGKKYGIKVSQVYYGDLRYTKKKKAKKYHNRVKNSVKNGNWAIVLVGKGRWTGRGHFILWYKTEGDYVYIRDPNSKSANRAKAKLSTLQKQTKRYWIINVPESKKVN